jgi:hypothetical protein
MAKPDTDETAAKRRVDEVRRLNIFSGNDGGD